MTVTFFGHKDTPKEAEPALWATLVDLIKNHNATEFYVGNNGNFDIMVCHQLKDLSQLYPISYSVVLAYLPTNKNKCNELTSTIFPEGIEFAPKRFAVSYRNKWMIQQSDMIITYVTRNFGGAWQFKKMAIKQGKRIIELSK